jgi:hypothetical protein
MTISISADDEYRFYETSGRTVRCDGQDRPIGNNRTLGCTKKGVTVLDLIQKENGTKIRTTRDELSADGNVFTTTVTEFPPNKPTFTYQIIYSRVSGSSGFAGQWRDTSYLQQHADMILRLDNHGLYVDYPSAGQYIDAPLNGAEAAVRGPNAPEDTAQAVQPSGSREFLTTTKRHGEVFRQGSLTLSSDGRILTDSWWNPDRPAVKGTLVYDKEIDHEQP